MELRSSAQIISDLDNKVIDLNTEISQMKQWCKKYDHMVKKLLVTNEGSMVVRSLSKG